MKTRAEKIEEFIAKLDIDNIDIPYFVDVETVENYQDIYDAIEEGGGFNVDIIYYATAMEFLQENDPSLRESLGIASEMGFTPENLNSETLASLLASQQAREEFQELEEEIDNFFADLDEEDEEEDK